MTTFAELLKRNPVAHVRDSYAAGGEKRLYWNKDYGQFEVTQRPNGKRKSVVLIRTKHEHEAVEIFAKNI